MTLSPDGEWLWTGEEWIPAPPTVSPNQNSISDHIKSAAQQFGISESRLSQNVPHYDINRDGRITRDEVYTAASAIHSPAVHTIDYGKRIEKNKSSSGTRTIHTFGVIIMIFSLFLPWIDIPLVGGISSIEWMISIFGEFGSSSSSSDSSDLGSLIPDELVIGLLLFSFGPFVAIFSSFVTCVGILSADDSTWVMGAITSAYMLALIGIGYGYSVNLLLVEVSLSDFFGIGVFGMLLGSVCTAIK